MKIVWKPKDPEFREAVAICLESLYSFLSRVQEGLESVDQLDTTEDNEGIATDFTIYFSKASSSPVEIKMTSHFNTHLNN
jgi:hypothetical protein